MAKHYSLSRGKDSLRDHIPSTDLSFVQDDGNAHSFRLHIDAVNDISYDCSEYFEFQSSEHYVVSGVNNTQPVINTYSIPDTSGINLGLSSQALKKGTSRPRKQSKRSNPKKVAFPFGDQIEIKFIKGRGIRNAVVARLYGLPRNTPYNIRPEALRVPKKYWDRKRITASIRRELSDDAPGSFIFRDTNSDLNWIRQCDTQENEINNKQMKKYIKELLSRGLGLPEGSFCLNFSMYRLLESCTDENVFFCDVIPNPKRDEEETLVTDVVVFSGASSRPYQQKVTAGACNTEFIKFPGYIRDKNEQNILVCIAEPTLRYLVPDKLESTQGFTLMAIPSSYKRIMPSAGFCEFINSEAQDIPIDQLFSLYVGNYDINSSVHSFREKLGFSLK